MATITIDEIQQLLHKRGERDALPYQSNGEGYFLELIFEKSQVKHISADEEYKNKVLSVDCDYGTVLILFNEYGLLKSIEIC